MNNQYVKCYNFRDLYKIMYGEEYPLLKINKTDASDQAKLIRKQMETAKEQWDAIVEQKKDLFDQKGFIRVYVDEGGSITLNGGGPGRPQKLKSKDIKISLRLDEATHDKIKKYCTDQKISPSEALRQAVDLIVGK